MSIFDQFRMHPEYSRENSAEWFMRNVRSLAQGGVAPTKLIADHPDQQKSTISIGEMYMFLYDPIHKDTLPVWDKFPLVLPFSSNGDYFTGLNLHYMRPQTRLSLLDKLTQVATHKTFNERAKLRLSWKLLNNAAKFPEVQGAVKCYHRGHVKSMYLKIQPKNWWLCAILPTERFQKKNNQQTWGS